MKILFSGVDFSSRTGPNTFAYRLADELVKNNHHIANVNDYDVALVFIEPSHNLDPSKPSVQRLDGIWSKPSEFDYKNKNILKFYNQASGIIFQSEFDKKFITTHWGLPKNYDVIRNGVRIEPITQFTSQELLNLRNEYDKIFVCSANWHKQKRLKENTELFLNIRKKLGTKCCLLVLGNNPDCVVADPHIFYTGSIESKLYMEIYSMSDWMIHLAYCDHAPNVVVECLSQNTPVICSSSGGTKEIVGEFGIILNEENEFDWNLFDYDQPPYINVSNINLIDVKNNKKNDVSIKTSSKNYVNFLLKTIQENIK